MTESEIVKMCVVGIPIACTMLIAIVGGIISAIHEYRHKNDCKSKDWQELLKYMTED